MKTNHYWNPQKPGEGFSLYFFQDGNVWGQFYDKEGWLGIYGKAGQSLKVFKLIGGNEVPWGTATTEDKGNALEVRMMDKAGNTKAFSCVPLFPSPVLVDGSVPVEPVRIEKNLFGDKWVDVPVPLSSEFEVNHDNIQTRKAVGKYRIFGDGSAITTSQSGKHNPDIVVQGNEITLYLGPTTSDSPVTGAHFLVSTVDNGEIMNLSAKVTKA